MDQWEYKYVFIGYSSDSSEIEEKLNVLGSSGWKLISFFQYSSRFIAILMRKKN